MKGCGQPEQHFAGHIKNKPGGQKTQHAMRRLKKSNKPAAFQERRPGQLFQASSTNDPAMMFGNALATEKLTTRWAAGDGFTSDVVQATLKE
jgi:hypothetical protein